MRNRVIPISPIGSIICLCLRYIWDQYQTCLSVTYGTGPKRLHGLSWHFSSKKSHTSFWEAYGTGPIHVSHACMGPVQCFATRPLWDWSHKVYGTPKKRNSQNFNGNFRSSSPIYGSEGPMGLVPCLHLRYIWDWSHACLLGKYGTCPMGTSNFRDLSWPFSGM